LTPDRPFKRSDRIGKQILEILGEIVNRHLRLDHIGFVTFTNADLSPDLRNAKIYFSVLNPRMDIEDILTEMNHKVPAFKRFMAPELHLRNIPDLHFYYDDAEEHRTRIDSLVRSIQKSRSNDPEHI
jgi:ribosome-binding factor A